MKHKMRISIWMTTIAVIVFILLMALTVNRVREKDIVDQFSMQQLALARGTAARIEALLGNVEKNLTMLSLLPSVRMVTPDETVSSMKVIHDHLEGKVRFIARLDERGILRSVYPNRAFAGLLGERFDRYTFFHQIRKTRGPFVGELDLSEDTPLSRTLGMSRAVVIGVPKYRYGDGTLFTGVVFAIMPLEKVIDFFGKEPQGKMAQDSWIVDHQGRLIVHPAEGFIGRDVSVLEKRDNRRPGALQPDILRGRAGYGEYLLNEEGASVERKIVAYAPIGIGPQAWFMVVSTPYNRVISVVRRAFLNVMMGVAGVIIAVIIAGISIDYAERRHLRMKEKLRLLRERNEWQDQLVREKRTVEGIIEGLPIPAFVIDREHKIILWNKACTELTGFSAQTMIGTDRHYAPFYTRKRPLIADLIIDGDIENLEKYYGTKKIRKSSTVEGAYEARDFFQLTDGRSHHLYFLAAPIHDEKGEVIAAIETLQDHTREEEMSRSIKEYAETLQVELTENINLRTQIESLNNYLQSILESSPDKLYDMSGDGIVNYISHDFARGGGMTSGPVKGRHFTEFMDPELREFMMQRWEEGRRGNFTPYEIEVTAGDGSRRNLLITTRPLKGTDRFVVAQRDITEFKNLEKKYYESQKLAAVGQLSAGIAHEIRNPLSSIKMSLQILEKRLQPQGNDQKRFRIAQKEVEHLEHLVNDVLIFAKPSEPRKERYDVRRILEETLAMAEKGITEKAVRVATAYDEAAPPVLVDPAMLEQAFLNLIRNGIDAMEDNGTLTLRTRYADGAVPAVEIEIRDEGCGINPEDMPHLFNPFFTKKKYGTGLGLTQVKKIIELHQGTIEIQSRPGEGTRVVITLPVPLTLADRPPASPA